ncbi:hypothetical protein LTR22_025381, partial [Elasticomyces elasticus]
QKCTCNAHNTSICLNWTTTKPSAAPGRRSACTEDGVVTILEACWKSKTVRVPSWLHEARLKFTLTLPDPLHHDFGVKEGEYLPGTVLPDYLAEYAKHWNIYERVRFKKKALETDKVEDGNGWHLTVSSPAGQDTLVTKKLIVVTGLTSQPQALQVKGQD